MVAGLSLLEMGAFLSGADDACVEAGAGALKSFFIKFFIFQPSSNAGPNQMCCKPGVPRECPEDG